MSFKQRMLAAMKAFAEPNAVTDTSQLMGEIAALKAGSTVRANGRQVNLEPLDNAYKKKPSRADRTLHYINKALDAANLKTGRVLEIGGRENPRSQHFTKFEYTALDLVETGPGVLVGDITDCPHIPDNSFDFILSVDVFEHINAPWKAAKEISRILKPGGSTYHTTLFSWRYHPCPIDYWRYTPEALAFIFSDLESVEASFDDAERRRDITGAGRAHPIKPDALGGWRENWRVHYIGMKK